MVAPLVTIGPAKTSLAPAAADEPPPEALVAETPDASRRASGVRGVSEAAAPAFPITLSLFLFSGATALIDQLCFSKYLSYVVGSTAYAVSAVLAAFMTCLLYTSPSPRDS